VQDLQVSFHIEINMKRQVTYYSEGLTNSLSSCMESTRLFIEEGTHHATYTSVSIIPFTRRGEKDNIPVNHWAIPWSIWKAMEEEKEAEIKGHTTKKQQQLLNFKTVMGP